MGYFKESSLLNSHESKHFAAMGKSHYLSKSIEMDEKQQGFWVRCKHAYIFIRTIWENVQIEGEELN